MELIIDTLSPFTFYSIGLILIILGVLAFYNSIKKPIKKTITNLITFFFGTTCLIIGICWLIVPIEVILWTKKIISYLVDSYIGGIFFLVLGLYNLYQAKINPYESYTDINIQRWTGIIGTILLGLFIIFIKTKELFGW